MSEKDLIPVNIQTFRGAIRDIDFDVFLKLSEDNVVHVFSRTTGLDYKRLAQYIQKGVKELFIRRNDEPAYRSFVSRPALTILNDPTTSQERKIATLLNLTEQNMTEILMQANVEEKTAASTRAVVKNYVDFLIGNPQSLAIILKLVSHGEYLYYHSIAVSIFSMFIAKASGQFNRKTFELLAMGGFLHDIGMANVPKEIMDSPNELTETEWEKIHDHTTAGLRMVENTPNIPDEVRYIIYQHHERPSGRGYPNGIYGTTIYHPAKVVAVADAFSALISKRPFRAAYTVEQAIEILKEEHGRYDQDLIAICEKFFLSRLPRAKAA